jgi:hypothetical protein
MSLRTSGLRPPLNRGKIMRNASFGILLGSVVAGFWLYAAPGCSSTQSTPKVIHVAVDSCVEIVKNDGNVVHKVCATLDDLMPFIEQIMSAQAERAAKAAGSAVPVASSATPVVAPPPPASVPVVAPSASAPKAPASVEAPKVEAPKAPASVEAPKPEAKPAKKTTKAAAKK